MLFLGVVTFLCYVNFFAFLRWRRKDSFSAMIALFAAGTAGLATLLGAIGPESVSMDAVNWSVPLFAISGVLSIFLYGRKIKRGLLRSDQSSFQWRTGITGLALLSAAYLIVSVIDHYWFLRDSEKIGVVYAPLEGAPNVCDKPFLVHFDDISNTATYRCPEVIFGPAFSNSPFMPLGTYQQAESVEVRRALRSLLANAKDATNPTDRE